MKGQPAGAPIRGHSKVGHPIRWVAALYLVGLVASAHAGTYQIEGRIVGADDGGAIKLLDVDYRQHSIRLDGIGAPELGQPLGRASKQHLAELLANWEAPGLTLWPALPVGVLLARSSGISLA
jgi:endonuclease YncB( thermonuclease family)